MKRYKLLKDTPCVKAGTVFEEIISMFGVNSLFNKDLDYRIFVDKINNFDEWFEEIPEEYKRPRVEYGEVYYFVDDSGQVSVDCDYRRYMDHCRYDNGNYSVTEEGSKTHKAKRIAQQIIEDDAKGFVPDWGDEDQVKYYGQYNHRHNCLEVDNNYWSQNQDTIYFKTVEDIEESFKKHRKEWLTVLGVEEEKQEN